MARQGIFWVICVTTDSGIWDIAYTLPEASGRSTLIVYVAIESCVLLLELLLMLVEYDQEQHLSLTWWSATIQVVLVSPLLVWEVATCAPAAMVMWIFLQLRHCVSVASASGVDRPPPGATRRVCSRQRIRLELSGNHRAIGHHRLQQLRKVMIVSLTGFFIEESRVGLGTFAIAFVGVPCIAMATLILSCCCSAQGAVLGAPAFATDTFDGIQTSPQKANTEPSTGVTARPADF